MKKAKGAKSPQSPKTKTKGHSQKSIEALIDALIPGASKKLLENPSKQLIVMGDKERPGDLHGTIRNLIALLCDSNTEKSLSDLLDKMDFPRENRPGLYEFVDTQIRGMNIKKLPSIAGAGSGKSREANFDWPMIQDIANEIWTKFRSFSKSQVAEKVHSRLESFRTDDRIPTIGTIRHKITKL